MIEAFFNGITHLIIIRAAVIAACTLYAYFGFLNITKQPLEDRVHKRVRLYRSMFAFIAAFGCLNVYLLTYGMSRILYQVFFIQVAALFYILALREYIHNPKAVKLALTLTGWLF